MHVPTRTPHILRHTHTFQPRAVRLGSGKRLVHKGLRFGGGGVGVGT